jgi:hypothetical protein
MPISSSPLGAASDETNMDSDNEINMVSEAVKSQIDVYATRYGLDSKVVQKLCDVSDEVASSVIAVELPSQTRNSSAYVSRVLRDKIRESDDHGAQNQEAWGGATSMTKAPKMKTALEATSSTSLEKVPALTYTVVRPFTSIRLRQKQDGKAMKNTKSTKMTRHGKTLGKRARPRQADG